MFQKQKVIISKMRMGEGHSEIIFMFQSVHFETISNQE